MCRKTLRRILDGSLKRMYNGYKMELIYVQTRVKGPGSPELAPGNGKNFANFLYIWYRHTQMFSQDLTDRNFAGDYDYES